VINAVTGQVAEHLDYDAFGRVTLDTNPGFQPFGFAGGLYEPMTGLVHFGARDYDSASGRWTARDPIGFDGGSSGIYLYVSNDPVDEVDPSGTAGGRDKDYCDDVVSNTTVGVVQDVLHGRPAAFPGIAIPAAALWWNIGHAVCAMGYYHELSRTELQWMAVGVSLIAAAPGARGAFLPAQVLTLDDVLENPQLLRGVSPARPERMLGNPSDWRVEGLGRGSHKGQGLGLREYTPGGTPTGRLMRWPPGGGRHGPQNYWIVSSPRNGKSPRIPGASE
jgi:RHS repeat-associated protein